MPRVTFPTGMQRHLACAPLEVEGSTVRNALDAAFAIEPRARGYLLDDQGALRPHVAIFVDSIPIRDRKTLLDPVRPASDILVVQALSGG
ncbi:MAG: MoaD/ThiS family protein [Planctomycetota bacterium]